MFDLKLAHAYPPNDNCRYKIGYHELGETLFVGWNSMPSKVFHYVKDEVKGCEDSRYHPDSKLWSVKHPRYSRRTANILGLLTHGEIPHTDPNALRKYYNKTSNKTSKLSLVPDAQTYLDRIPFYPFQSDDFLDILIYRRLLLAYDMGLGKTLMGLATMQYAKDHMTFSSDTQWSQDDADNFWVVGPRSALIAWEEQLSHWNNVTDGLLSVKPRLVTNSIQAINKSIESAIQPPNVLIIDESANVKNIKAKRTQAIKTLSDSMYRSFYHNNQSLDYVLCLTGTPAPKDPTDWWAQLEILQGGWLKEKAPGILLHNLANMSDPEEGTHGTYRKNLGWKLDELQRFHRRIRPIVRVRKKIEVAKDLPDKIYISRHIKPTPSIISATALVVQSEPGNIALNICRQFSDGFKYDKEHYEKNNNNDNNNNDSLDPDDIIYAARRITTRLDHNPKLDQLIADIEEIELNEENRVVVWAGFQASIDIIVEKLLELGWSVIKLDGRALRVIDNTQTQPVLVKDKVNIQEMFQDTEQYNHRLAFVGNPQAAGQGLTLTKASTAIYYSNSFKGDARPQSEDRIHRLGMDTSVAPRIIDYLHLPTDQYVLNNVRKKRSLEKVSKGEVLNMLETMDVITA